MRTATGSVYYLTDNQGTVIGLVNNQGQKVAGVDGESHLLDWNVD